MLTIDFDNNDIYRRLVFNHMNIDSCLEQHGKSKDDSGDTGNFSALPLWTCSQAKVCSSRGRLPFLISQFYILRIIISAKQLPVHCCSRSHNSSQISATYAGLNENIIQIILQAGSNVVDRWPSLSQHWSPSLSVADIPASSLPVASRHSSAFQLAADSEHFWHCCSQRWTGQASKPALRLTTNHTGTELMSLQRDDKPGQVWRHSLLTKTHLNPLKRGQTTVSFPLWVLNYCNIFWNLKYIMQLNVHSQQCGDLCKMSNSSLTLFESTFSENTPTQIQIAWFVNGCPQ